jgi:hypothetical protein
MMLPSWRHFVLVLCSAASVSQAQLFSYDVAAGEGLCSSDEQTLISTMLADSKTLVNSALWAVSQRQTKNDKVLAFFTSYFGIQWDFTQSSGFKPGPSEATYASVVGM